MILIKEKKNCCGCSACVQKCPKQCISLQEDNEGFFYPIVDQSICIDCYLCEKVCPVIIPNNKREPIEVYAGKNPNEDIRQQSSSGGVFTLLAEHVIDGGGIVFGARFNEYWEVVHDYVDTKQELYKFRGSKYVQSKIGLTYKQAEAFLKEGRFVLYSGTPCQIAGLKKFLRKDYENLLSIDFICHGVPSPGVFRTYLQNEINKVSIRHSEKNIVLTPCIPLIAERDRLDLKGMTIKSIFFRDKRKGWREFGLTIEFINDSVLCEKKIELYSDKYENLFLRGFLRDLYLRPSCHTCPTKNLSSGSDITLGDWWGIDSLIPEIDDNKGISAVVVNTEFGKDILYNLNVQLYAMQYEELVKRNPAIITSTIESKNREDFFVEDKNTFEEKVKLLVKVPVSYKKIIRQIAYRITPQVVKNIIKRII